MEQQKAKAPQSDLEKPSTPPHNPGRLPKAKPTTSSPETHAAEAISQHDGAALLAMPAPTVPQTENPTRKHIPSSATFSFGSSRPRGAGILDAPTAAPTQPPKPRRLPVSISRGALDKLA